MVNYQKELEKIIEENQKKGIIPTLMLHVCCAPCSSYCLEYLSKYFKITVFYFNPNIHPAEEYTQRVNEVKRLIREMETVYPVDFLEGEFKPEDFYFAVKGFEKEKEAGERCFLCYRQRLYETALKAKELNFDYFTTTLTISPLKNAQKINEIALDIEKELGVRHLPSDFKKKNGYKRSIELSKKHKLYRQNYCGCVFSLKSE